MTEENDKTPKTIEAIVKLDEWHKRLQKSQIGHYKVAERYALIGNYLRVPLVLVSAIVSTTVIATLIPETPPYVSYIAAGLSITSTLFAALLSSTRVEEKSILHERCAGKYGKLRRKIETFLASEKNKDEAIIFLSEIQLEWEIISEDAPLTPSWARKTKK